MVQSPDAAAQAKGLKTAATALIAGGLLIGIALPAFCGMQGIVVFLTPWGFDAIWPAGLLVMAVDFVMAWTFWRRAAAIERAAQGLPPKP